MAKPKTLSQAVDQAIAAENRRVVETLCRYCAGTGTIYRTVPASVQMSVRETCPKCKGTGLR